MTKKSYFVRVVGLLSLIAVLIPLLQHTIATHAMKPGSVGSSFTFTDPYNGGEDTATIASTSNTSTLVDVTTRGQGNSSSYFSITIPDLSSFSPVESFRITEGLPGQNQTDLTNTVTEAEIAAEDDLAAGENTQRRMVSRERSLLVRDGFEILQAHPQTNPATPDQWNVQVFDGTQGRLRTLTTTVNADSQTLLGQFRTVYNDAMAVETRLIATVIGGLGSAAVPILTTALVTASITVRIAAVIGAAVLLVGAAVAAYPTWRQLLGMHSQLVAIFNTILATDAGFAHELTPITPQLTPTPTP